MTELREIESTWRVALPRRFAELQADLDWDALRLPGGSVHKVPWPVLTLQQIVDAYALREYWHLPIGFLPLIGDFHVIIGLDYSVHSPTVIALNDARKSQHLFNDFDTFLAARFLVDEPRTERSGIVEKESCLDI